MTGEIIFAKLEKDLKEKIQLTWVLKLVEVN